MILPGFGHTSRIGAKLFIMIILTPISMQPVQIRVAQGSILSPLLFTIFMNDLPSIVSNSKITLYADDAAIYHARQCVYDLQSNLNAVWTVLLTG